MQKAVISFFIVGAAVLSCSTPSTQTAIQDTAPDKATMKQEIIAADKAMSEMAQKDGFYKALSAYADSGFVKLDDGSLPITGKKSFDEKYNGHDGPKTLSWEPLAADAAASGDLGYSWGNWKFVQPDTTYYGNYFTAWKKQADGSWKITLDGGNNTPAPQQQ